MAKITSFLFSAALGIGALALLNFTAPYTGLSLGWSAWTIGTGVLLGLPGTVLLVVLKILL